MNRRNRIILVTLLGIAAVAVVGVWLFRRTPYGHTVWPPRRTPTVSDVPVYSTPMALHGRTLQSLYLRVRAIDDEGSAILITRGKMWVDLPDVPKLWPVYRYDSRPRTLSRVFPSEWKDAAGAIVKGGRGIGADRFLCKEVDGIEKYRARPGEELREFDTVGEFALSPAFSPDGRTLCVLTADGPARPRTPGPGGWLSPRFGGGYYGQHYLELFRVPDVTPVGEAVRIPFTTVDQIDMPCWSADGRFLVYANYEGTRMCVIHVDQEGQSN